MARSADILYTFGELALKLAGCARDAAAVDGSRVYVQSFREDQREDLTATLLSELTDGDLVLLKGSRGLEMERIVQALVETTEDSNPIA